MQRDGVGFAANMARHHAHRAKLTHGARRAQNHPVQQAPFDIGQRHPPEGLPARGAQHPRGLFFIGALRLHQRNQLAGDKRESHKHGGQHNARHGKDDFHVMRRQPRPQPALRAKQQHVNQAGHHWRHRKRQVNQRDQHLFARKLKLGDGPGGGHAKHQIQRHGNHRGQQGQLDGLHRLGLDQRRQIQLESLGQGLVKHADQRGEQKHRQIPQRQRGERQPHPGRLGGAAAAAVGRRRKIHDSSSKWESGGQVGGGQRRPGRRLAHH